MAGATTYSERIRWAMKTGNNPSGSPLTLRDLAHRTGFSYENCRKVFKGEHDGSREFNASVCVVLGLPEDEMWHFAEESKAQRRLGMSFLTSLPKDRRLLLIWPRLTEADREKVIRIAEGLALFSEAARISQWKGRASKQTRSRTMEENDVPL